MSSCCPRGGRSARDSEAGPPRRKNGFEWPLHPLQVLSWVVAGLDVVLFGVFVLPLVASDAAGVVAVVIFVCSVVGMVISAAGATVKDPVDEMVLREDQHPKNTSADQSIFDFCPFCNIDVQPRSKHCRDCNKCVGVFDHHCMWLNNCIGKKNYLDFLGAIVSVAVMVGTMLIVSCAVIADFFEEGAVRQRLEETGFLESVSKEFVLVVIIFLSVINLPLFLLDVQLLVLHMFLMSQGLTTYEYILIKSGRFQTATSVSDRAKAGVIGAGKVVSHKMKTLPSCMDWIVFARCCKKRRGPRLHKDASVRPECSQESESASMPKPSERQCLGVPMEDPAPASDSIAPIPNSFAAGAVVGRPVVRGADNDQPRPPASRLAEVADEDATVQLSSASRSQRHLEVPSQLQADDAAGQESTESTGRQKHKGSKGSRTGRSKTRSRRGEAQRAREMMSTVSSGAVLAPPVIDDSFTEACTEDTEREVG